MNTDKKQNDIKDVVLEKLSAQHLENLFYVHKNEYGDYFYNIIKTVNFPEEIDPTFYTQYETKPKDTWTVIAHEFYNDITLWWIVCSANRIMNPVKQPEPGTILKILQPGIVRNILNKLKDS